MFFLVFPLRSSQVSLSPLKTFIGNMNQSRMSEHVHVTLRIYSRRVQSVHRTALCVLLSVHCISPKDLISGRHKLTLGRIVPPRTKDQALACIKKVNKIIHRQWHFSVSIIKCKVVPCLWTSDLTLSLFTAAFCLSGHVYLSWLSCWPITFPHLAMQRNQLLTTNLATIHGLVHLSICKER